MKLARRPRIVTALIALISILFTQVAVAAYVCPSIQVGQALATMELVMSVHEQHDMLDCDEADIGQSAMCDVQVQVGSQSLDKPASPQITPFADLAHAVAYLIIKPIPAQAPITTGLLVPTRETAPPLSIQNCCFRI